MPSLVVFLTAIFIGTHVANLAEPTDGSATRLDKTILAISLALLAIAFTYQLFGWWELFTGDSIGFPSNASVALLAIASGTIFLRVLLRKRRRGYGYAFSRAGADQPTHFDFAARVALTLIATQLLVTLATTLAQFPRGFEGTAYHLPLAVHFMKTGSLLPWDRHYPHTFPALASLYYALVLGGGPERLASATGFAFLPLILLSTYGTSRNLNASSSASALVTCGMMSIPVIAFGIFEVEADIVSLSFVCAALFFATRGASNRHLAACIVGALCGAAYSAKPSSLAAGAGVALILVLRPNAEGDDNRTRRAVTLDFHAASLFCVCFIGMAGYWLARNWILFGNPLYPIGSQSLQRLLGWPLSRGFTLAVTGQQQYWWVRRPLEWFVYPWVEYQRAGQSYTAHTGYGAFTAALLIPCFLYAGVKALVCRGNLRQLSLVWIAALLVIVAWAVTERQPRYLIPVFAFLVPIAGNVVEHARANLRMALQYLSVFAIALMSVAVMGREVVGFGDRIVFSKMTERHLFYEYPMEVDNLPNGSVILNLGSRTWHYPLFGTGLRNRVLSTPAARSALGLPPTLDRIGNARLGASVIHNLGATHVFSDGSVSFDNCLHAEEIGRWAVNPVNRKPLAEARRLFRVTPCAAAAGAR